MSEDKKVISSKEITFMLDSDIPNEYLDKELGKYLDDTLAEELVKKYMGKTIKLKISFEKYYLYYYLGLSCCYGSGYFLVKKRFHWNSDWSASSFNRDRVCG